MPRVARSRQSIDKILTAVVEEQLRQRERVSRYLHDEVGQILSAVGLQMDCLRLETETESPEIAGQLKTCQGHLGKAIDQVRSLSQELSANAVERVGLAAALDRLVRRFRARHDNFHLTFDGSLRLPPAVAAAFYQIAEQALDNALHHSHADRVDLIVRTDRGGAILEVCDDGRGFDPEATPQGLGLLLMDHLAAKADLRFDVTSRAGKGTIVKARCPAANLRHGFESFAG